jgi:hypothetical protein
MTWSCIAAALVVVGCGLGDPKGVKVTGQVLQNGKPIKVLPSEEIMVGFSSEAPEGQHIIVAWATVLPDDGTFTISGSAGKGIPAGKYRVIASSQIYQKNEDRFEAVFDEKKPPLIAEVGPEEGQSFVIDVGKRTLTKR